MSALILPTIGPNNQGWHNSLYNPNNLTMFTAYLLCPCFYQGFQWFFMVLLNFQVTHLDFFVAEWLRYACNGDVLLGIRKVYVPPQTSSFS